MASKQTTLTSRVDVAANSAEQEYYLQMIEVAVRRGNDIPDAMTFAANCLAEQKQAREKAAARLAASRMASRRTSRPKTGESVTDAQ